MLDEEQSPARAQDAGRLGQRRGGVGNRAEDEGEDGGVEARVLEREVRAEAATTCAPAPVSATFARSLRNMYESGSARTRSVTASG